MAELDVAVLGSSVTPYALTPSLSLALRIQNRSGGTVHSVALRTQVRVEPAPRRYAPEDTERLKDLFGPPGQWAGSLHPFLWAELSTVVPTFTATADVELLLPCSYDLEVRAGRYLHGLRDGDVPMVLLFSGTVFEVVDDRMSVTPIPWHTECRYRLPVSTWRAAMDSYFPGAGWLRLSLETIDALAAVKASEALATWDDVIRHVLDGRGA